MIIIGNGTDMIEISRIAKAVNENPRFVEKIFTESERAYFIKKGNNKMQTIAGAFAAKEAAVKSIGTGFGIVSFHDVVISWDSLGKPVIHIENYKDVIFMTSISHCKDYAVANVIAVKG